MSALPVRLHTATGERQARLSTGATRPLCERGYGNGAGGLGQPDPACDCVPCQRYFGGVR